MRKDIRHALAGAAFALAGAAAGRAEAQVVVTDTSLLLKAKDTLSAVQSQLSTLQQITGQVQKLEQTVGSFGPSTVSGILSSLPNLGMFKNVWSGLTPTISTTNYNASLSSNSSFTSGLNALSTALSQAQNGITQTKNALSGALYVTPTSGGLVTQAQAEAMVAVRVVNAREAAANAMAAGMQTRSDLAQNAQSDLTALTNGAKAAQDLRGEMAANNAIMLKLLEQEQKNAALLASIAHLSGSTAVSADTVQNASTK